MEESREALGPLTQDVVDVLIENQRRFLAFLERRVGSRAAAEEILQSAYARAVEKGVPLDDAGGAVNWFFAVLRNSTIDHYRQRATESRAIESLTREGIPEIVDPELRDEVCACFRRLLPTIHADYAVILEKVDLEERPVSDVAQELGITSNNASVRLYRARAALRTQLERSCGACATHGCLECSCAGDSAVDYRVRARTRGRAPNRGAD